jgi:hypothetical protein
VVFVCFNFQASTSALSREDENPLIGKMLLFIAKKTRRIDEYSDNAVEVIRLTDELDIVKEYHAAGNNYTPIKVNSLILQFLCYFLLIFGLDQYLIIY